MHPADRRLWQRGGVRRARPPCCWTPTTRLALDQTISAGSANFFIEANTGAATGSFYGFQNLSDENLKTNLRPVRRPAHEGGVLAGLHLQRRIELVKKRRGGDSDCH